MESKKKIVNGETVRKCELTRNELSVLLPALNRDYCRIDEKRVNAGDTLSAYFYDEVCEKVNALIDKVQCIIDE